MLTYILRRLALMVPTLIGMTLMLFVIVRFAPGVGSGPGGLAPGGEMQSNEARLAQIKKHQQRLGMVDENGNKIPIYKQYFIWLDNTFKFWRAPVAGHVRILRIHTPVPTSIDLGESMQYRKPVWDLVRERVPTTATLNVVSIFFVYLIAIPGGMLAAVKRGRSFDVNWSLITLALYSLPGMWVGSMLIGFLANPQHVKLFPSAGLHATDTRYMTFLQYSFDYMWHLVLPIITMTYAGFAYLSKQMRASMLDNMSQDYARTARAKGLSGFVVVTRHVFRNSLLPLITIATGIIPSLIGGSVIIETMFSIKGMGELAFRATLARDLPVMQALGLISGVLVLISYIITDLCYAIADPRVSYD